MNGLANTSLQDSQCAWNRAWRRLHAKLSSSLGTEPTDSSARTTRPILTSQAHPVQSPSPLELRSVTSSNLVSADIAPLVAQVVRGTSI